MRVAATGGQQSKKLEVLFARMGPPPPVNRATKPKKTYASTLGQGPKRPVTVAQAAKVIPQVPIEALARPSQGQAMGPSNTQKRKKRIPSFVAGGPSRRQILIAFGTGSEITCDFNLFICRARAALRDGGSTLQILSMDYAYTGYALHTDGVASERDLEFIRGLAHNVFGKTATGIHVGLPTSTTFIKIVDIPWFTNPELTKVITPDEIQGALLHSPLGNDLYFARNVRLSGARAKKLINQSVMVCGIHCFIREATVHISVPICQRCWKWGHSEAGCRQCAAICPHCMGPHRLEEHWAVAKCCKGNAKVNPPIPTHSRRPGVPSQDALHVVRDVGQVV
ncbi:hypothetical protein CPC08DRAFT_770952 [Agrocybe pediades]|nr:hypothetical protein CPC08DRAFT_770952 [Agrocybe pediades]